MHTSPEQKGLRTEAFDLKQELAHAEAVFRKSKAVVDAQKAKESEIGKLQALKEHKLPPAATVDAVIAAVLKGA